MGYVMNLRKLVGTQPLVIVGASVIVIDELIFKPFQAMTFIINIQTVTRSITSPSYLGQHSLEFKGHPLEGERNE